MLLLGLFFWCWVAWAFGRGSDSHRTTTDGREAMDKPKEEPQEQEQKRGAEETSMELAPMPIFGNANQAEGDHFKVCRARVACLYRSGCVDVFPNESLFAEQPLVGMGRRFGTVEKRGLFATFVPARQPVSCSRRSSGCAKHPSVFSWFTVAFTGEVRAAVGANQHALFGSCVYSARVGCCALALPLPQHAHDYTMLLHRCRPCDTPLYSNEGRFHASVRESCA